jgi:recombination protein RecT
LIPYKDQCTLQLGYQGLLELVRRSGLVDSISAHLVRDKDEFDVQWGTEPGIRHRPYLDGDPGDVRLVYAVARLKGGGSHAELMTLHEIQAIRNRSQNVINADRWGKKTPWDTDFGEMARKTVLRRICKYLPKSPDLAAALALDDSASRGVQTLTMKDAIENTFVPPPYLVDESTGEIDPPPNEAVQGPAPEPARRGPGRPKKALEEQPPPAPPKAADDGPTRRGFDELAAEIAKAADAEIASLVLDEARDMLDAEELNDLALVYERQWKTEP